MKNQRVAERGLKLTTSKSAKKETDDLESIVKMVKKLTSEVLDLKRSVKESFLTNRPFRPFHKCNNKPLAKSVESSNANLNVVELGMDNLCSYHQSSHLEKTCPQRINLMTLVINSLLEQQSLEDQTKKTLEEESPLLDDDSTTILIMLLWDVVFDRETQMVGEVSLEETQLAKAPKPYNLRSKGPMADPSVEILNNKHIFNGDYPDHVLLRNTYTIHKLLYVDHQYSTINNNKTSRAFTH